MSKIHKRPALITSMIKITNDVFSMSILDEEIANSATPGQFISLYCKNGSRLLPRPISICELNKEKGTIRLVFRVLGEGTDELSKMKAGDSIEIMGPIGNGFILEGKKALLIGGGIGIPPMLELAKQLTCEKQIILGFRDDVFLKEDVEPFGKVYISTEDGSQGVKGNVIDVINQYHLEADIIFACGPTPMLRGVKAYAIKNGIKAQLSLEERMACGVGACLACTCKSTEVDEHTHVNNKRICKDGPVFYAQEVEL